MARREREEIKQDDGIKSKLISVNRITKVVKGGRIMRFAALVAVGDERGHVGIGTGKAKEVPEAIKKAELVARRSMIKVAIADNTIPHPIRTKYSKSVVLLKPAPEGNGIIAGGSVRALVELAGIKDITTKSYGSRNPINMVRATLKGLSELRSPEQIAALRGKSVEEIKD